MDEVGLVLGAADDVPGVVDVEETVDDVELVLAKILVRLSSRPPLVVEAAAELGGLVLVAAAAELDGDEVVVGAALVLEAEEGLAAGLEAAAAVLDWLADPVGSTAT